jgi:hypothetical protein
MSDLFSFMSGTAGACPSGTIFALLNFILTLLKNCLRASFHPDNVTNISKSRSKSALRSNTATRSTLNRVATTESQRLRSPIK